MTPIVVLFKNGSQEFGQMLGTDAAWRCRCGEVMIASTFPSIRDIPCPNTKCPRRYRLVGVSKKTPTRVDEI